VTTRTDLRAFLRFPWKVLGSDPVWVPPLLIDHASRFKRNFPFYEHGDVKSWLARSPQGEVLGRISGVVNRLHNEFHHDQVGFFGFFDSVNDVTVARMLLEIASAWLREQGMTSIRGPMNFSVNEECGMLIDGFDTPPAIMMLHNPPYYNDLMAACGLVKAKDLYAYQMSGGEISARITELAPKLERRLKVRIRPFNPKDFWGEVQRVEQLYNQSWESNWGFVPMTHKELKLMAQTLKLVYDPRIIQFVETDDGKVVGFSLALPDVHVIFKQMNGRLLPTGIFRLLAKRRKLSRLRMLLLGVTPEYRKRGIDVLLYYHAYTEGRKVGYEWGEFSWILEDNFEMNEAANAMGAKRYKTWRIWEKAI
jgi:GNAT superfamily N-acetyltransferase